MRIENHQLNVSEAFKDYHYLVPEYQREYVWQEDNVSQLLEDIVEEYEKDADSQYFIGSTVVTKNKDGEYEVIDGQQRLTTLFLTVCAFKKILKDREQEEFVHYLEGIVCAKSLRGGKMVQLPHLTLQYENSSRLLEKILAGEVISEEFYGSSKNIKTAYEVATDYISRQFEDSEELTKFCEYFLEKVSFIQIDTQSISDALKIFETVNERGIGLNPMDLLKNLIFMQIDKEKFSSVNSEWKKITDLLAKNGQKPLRFLRYFLLANYQVKDKKGRLGVYEDEIYDWISNHDEQCGYTKKPFEFLEKIIENSESYINFSKGLDINGKPSMAIQNIYRLAGDRYSLYLILALAGRKLTTENFEYLMNQIEVLVFHYIMSRSSMKELERNFIKWAALIRAIGETDEQDEAIKEFVAQYITPNVEKMTELSSQAFLYSDWNSFPRYRLKYILSKIAQYVDTAMSPDKKPLGSYDSGEIEHILPNTPTPELIELIGDQQSYDKYKLKLGNLTLLEKVPNILAGRSFFTEKAAAYKASNFYITRSIIKKEELGSNNAIIRMNTKLLSFDNWGAEQIDQRQEMMAKLMLEIWKTN